MKTTNSKYSSKTFLIVNSIGILFSICIAILAIHIYKAPYSDTGMMSGRIRYLYLVGLSVLFMISFFGSIGSTLGFIKGNAKALSNELEVKLDNPYLFFRELPNDFGIGVASILIDSKIENKKDIVAVILDLCAKKYLELKYDGEKYIVNILKSADEKLLSNERYIMELISENRIKEIDYKKWYNLCFEDGCRLDLLGSSTKKAKKSELPKTDFNKLFIKICKIAGIIIGIVAFIIGCIYLSKNSIAYPSAIYIVYAILAVISILIGFAGSIAFGIILYIPFYLFAILFLSVSMGEKSYNETYNEILNISLIRTQKGKEEIHKLLAFKKFMKEFGAFASKKPEEIVLWDRYLSYAQLFGITDEIMKSGYKELVKNSSFTINSIDDITLENVYCNN